MKKYDLIVIGGGFSGVAAAISAKRQGVSVLLVEKGNSLGGAAANALVTPFMPYWTNRDGKREYLTRGIFEEIHNALEKRGALYYESFSEEELKYILAKMVKDEGVELLLHAYLTGVCRKDEKIISVSASTIEGTIELYADYFIDASANAQLSYLSGVETRLGRGSDSLCQPMTLCFRLGNVDVDAFFRSYEGLSEEYKKSRESGEITNPRENILVFKTPQKNVLHFNTTRVIKKNPTSALELTEAELIAREQVFEIYSFMKKHADGLKDSFLMMTGSEIGVRESRMIVGEHVLTEDECRSATKHADRIAACNYDIDIHNPEGAGTSHYYFKDGEYYTIPLRSLIPKGLDNMLVVGRCISADHGAQASLRIMPVVCAIGEAGGTLIGLINKEKKSTREADVKTLQEVLRKNGAFIG